jgi:hypothetical protein
MSSINPFSGYVAQGGQVERAAATDKSRQIRRQQVLSKNVAVRDDELEHQVESSDAIAAVHDDQQQKNPSQQQEQQKDQGKPKDGEEPPRLDITA